VARPAVFIDRDGTLNVDKNYLRLFEDWEWIPGAVEAIKAFNGAGFLVIVISNQAGVARGMYSEADINLLHVRVDDELRRLGARIDAYYYCPHHPEIGEERACDCRKPAPGMLLRAADDLAIDLSRSWMIGDKLTDVDAGHAANVATILVRTGYGDNEAVLSRPGQIIADNLLVACQYILSHAGKTSLCSIK
jgi:D-glycero-D-manno-heptose 1,7-bisphosphate phosphatase